MKKIVFTLILSIFPLISFAQNSDSLRIGKPAEHSSLKMVKLTKLPSIKKFSPILRHYTI
jgi:hypothetical protein